MNQLFYLLKYAYYPMVIDLMLFCSAVNSYVAIFLCHCIFLHRSAHNIRALLNSNVLYSATDTSLLILHSLCSSFDSPTKIDASSVWYMDLVIFRRHIGLRLKWVSGLSDVAVQQDLTLVLYDFFFVRLTSEWHVPVHSNVALKCARTLLGTEEFSLDAFYEQGFDFNCSVFFFRLCFQD